MNDLIHPQTDAVHHASMDQSGVPATTSGQFKQMLITDSSRLTRSDTSRVYYYSFAQLGGETHPAVDNCNFSIDVVCGFLSR